MKTIKKTCMAIFFLAVTTFTTSSQETPEQLPQNQEQNAETGILQDLPVDYISVITSFLENPFTQKANYPSSFKTLEDFENCFDTPKFQVEELINNRITISTDHIFLHYLKNEENSPIILEMTELTPTEPGLLKYGVCIGMPKETILSIFGTKFCTHEFSQNYEICYQGNSEETLSQVNFLFDYNDKLINIIIHQRIS